MKERVKTIEKARDNNETSVYVPIYQQSSNCRIPTSCELENISVDGEGFPNYFMEKYYGVTIYGYR